MLNGVCGATAGLYMCDGIDFSCDKVVTMNKILTEFFIRDHYKFINDNNFNLPLHYFNYTRSPSLKSITSILKSTSKNIPFSCYENLIFKNYLMDFSGFFSLFMSGTFCSITVNLKKQRVRSFSFILDFSIH